MFNFILLLLFPITNHWAVLSFAKLEDIELDNRVIDMFRSYNKVWHIETINFPPSIIFEQYFADGPLQIINYDVTENPTRPNIGNRCLHLIALYNSTRFTSYLSNIKNFYPDDLFMMWMKNESLHTGDDFQLKYGERIRHLFISNQIDSEFIFYRVCYKCGENRGRLIYLFTTDTKGTNITNLSSFWKNEGNFAGQHFKVAYIIYLPFMYYFYDSRGDIVLDGVYMKLFKTLSQRLNFTFSLTQHNSSYNNLIELMENAEFDFALGGFQITTEHLNIIPMISCYHWENILVAYNYNTTLLDTAKLYFNIFGIECWYAIMASLVICAFAFYLVIKFDIRIKRKISYLVSLHVTILSKN